MPRLAELIASAGVPEDAPVTVATINAAGGLDAAAAGHWRDGRPVSLDDRFYSASLAKQLTGAAAALLVRDARLDPDAPIATYLTGLPRWARDITARQLAHHTAGLPEAGVAEAQVTRDSWRGATAKAMRRPALGIATVVLSASDDMDAVLRLADAAFEQVAGPA